MKHSLKHLMRMAAVGACLMLVSASTGTAAERVIRMFAGGDGEIDYTPTRSSVRSAINPNPRAALRDLADQWQALHPGCRIEFVSAPPPEMNYRAWCVSNFVGGTIPDIVFQNMGVFRDSDFGKGWLVALDPYLAQPNPYVPGNARWLDLFYTPWIDAMRSLDGNVYWLAPDTIGVGLLCNVDLLAECGVTTMPTTLGEFLAACDRVQQAGALAYMPPYEWYVDCLLPATLWAEQIPAMDDDGNLIIDTRELTKAISSGGFNGREPRMRELVRLYRELSRRYPRGWNAMNPVLTFKQGRLAFMEAQSFHMQQIERDAQRKFAIRVIPFPMLTAEDSPFGGHPLAGGGNAGYTTTWQVTAQAEQRGVKELCIDWLQYITTPEHCERLVNELGFAIPGVRGAKPLPIFAPLMERAVADMQRPGYLDWHAFAPFTYTAEFSDNWNRIKQMLALGVLGEDEACERIEFWLQRAHGGVLRMQRAEVKP